MRVTRRIIELGLVLSLVVSLSFAGDQKPVGQEKPAGQEKPSGKEKASANQKDDLFFGEAFYHAYQGQFFEAIQRLDTELEQYHRLDEPGLDTLHRNIGEAEFSVGDFALDYRMQ